ncbi:hypothetical protein FOFC_17510 [Fusarium oxysporum]|nr:hypothetical protein FOFC_17510 [Fusarium oxysporum]
MASSLVPHSLAATWLFQISIGGPIIATVPIRVSVPSGKNSATISAFLSGVQNAATAVIPFEQTSLQHMQNSVWKLNRPAVSRGYLW